MEWWVNYTGIAKGYRTARFDHGLLIDFPKGIDCAVVKVVNLFNGQVPRNLEAIQAEIV
ncbi:MAG: hypothetical protein GY792_04295 [Gammaproteobacteria bacterium]|nr:hypothetical protein [Gammaproteobacteria bacterium]